MPASLFASLLALPFGRPLGRSLLQPRREAHIQIKGGQATDILLLALMLMGSLDMSARSGFGKAMEHRGGDRSKAHGHSYALRLKLHACAGPLLSARREDAARVTCLLPCRCTVTGTLNRSTMCRGDLLRKVWRAGRHTWSSPRQVTLGFMPLP